jgi:hypothetical protein
MPNFVYQITTISLYASSLILALIIDDIGLIFEWLSAFAVSCIAFIWPAVFFMLGERKFATVN